MEQTLGKRIMENRKRLGLTQDQLAEQLGVTAQAVSKWENDQSCPDITTLPRLAEIFGTTTDALLGREPVHEAQVITPDIDSDSDGDTVVMKWGSGRKQAFGFAFFVLLVGGLLLAVNLLHWDAGFWDILWPSALLVFGLWGLFPNFSFFRLGCALFGSYFLLDNLSLIPYQISGSIIWPVLLILFGLSLLFDAFRKPKKPFFHFSRHGKQAEGHHGGKFVNSFNISDDRFCCDLSFGDAARDVTLPKLRGGSANCAFGNLTLDLTGCESVSEDCNIDLDCSFGEMTLLVPDRFRVEPQSDTAFASVEVTGHPRSDAAGILYIQSDVSFGSIQIRYV